MKTISVIIPILNGGELIIACLRSLEPQLEPDDEIILVDNGSADGTPERVERDFPHVLVLRLRRNYGYGGGANRGMAVARGDAYLILNHDITFLNGCLATLRQDLEELGPCILGCKLLYPDGKTIQHAGGIIHLPRAFPDHYGYRQIDDGRWDQKMQPDYVIGALFVIDRAVRDAIGDFDEEFYPLYYEEVDYCFRAREAGFPVLYDPAAVAIHHESQTQDKRSIRYHQVMERNRLRFVLKHLPPTQLLSEFFPAEQAYLQQIDRSFACQVLAHAYRHTLLHLPDVLWLVSDAAARGAALNALSELWLQARGSVSH